MSWKPEIETANEPGKFYANNTAFATKEEAETAAKDIFNRWLLAADWRVVESDQPPNYTIIEGKLSPLSEEEHHGT